MDGYSGWSGVDRDGICNSLLDGDGVKTVGWMGGSFSGEAGWHTQR